MHTPTASPADPSRLLPTATVQKIITEILPPASGLSFARDARDLLIECCVEFITLISSEANDIAEKEAKKTIACEHVTKALEDLGFQEYVQEVLEVANEHKEQQKVSDFFFLGEKKKNMLRFFQGGGAKTHMGQTYTNALPSFGVNRAVRRSSPRWN